MSEMPAIFLSHGAPPLVDSAQWVDELSRWSTDLPRPTGDPRDLRALGVVARSRSVPLQPGHRSCTTSGASRAASTR